MREFFVVIIFLICACSPEKQPREEIADLFLRGRKLAELKNKDIGEISGMAASVSNPKLIWAHNDSGNKPDVYLLDEGLNVKLICSLDGVENRDWEDIATGPGPDSSKSYVYVADIGDNQAQYQYKHIYRFEEPVLSGAASGKITISSFDRITFKLSDTRKDTETLLLDPRSKDLYIVSKREESVSLYELKYPYNTNDTLVADKIMQLPFNKIVAGDFSVSGNEVLMKNYDHVYYWNTAGKSLRDALKEKPLEIQYEVEPQGESIAWAKEGTGFYTISEKNKGKKVYLYFYQRANP
ncbi:MAG TPA: hypothetical protein VFZ52_15525 [Chryseolinea sp.]